MKDEATPEQLELARRCAAKHWQTGIPSDEATARLILSGAWDDDAYTQAALLAIHETTSKAADLAYDFGGATAVRIRDALLEGDHLKGQDHG